MRPGVNGTSTVVAPVGRRLLDRGAAGEHDEVGERDLLAAAVLGAVEGLLDPLEGRQHRRQLIGVVDLPAVLRLEADPRSVGAAALVAAAERRCRRPRGRDELRHRQPRVENLALEGGDVLGPDQLVRHLGDRVLPQQRLRRDLRPEVALDRPHVAVRQLEPRPGERVRELVGVLVEAPRDRPVDGIQAQREVGRQHRRGTLRRVRVRDPGSCRRRRRPSPPTGALRPGSCSAPTRSRTGSRRSRSTTSSASRSR